MELVRSPRAGESPAESGSVAGGILVAASGCLTVTALPSETAALPRRALEPAGFKFPWPPGMHRAIDAARPQ